ncbi:MAG: hypothetical protein WCO96_10170 [Actinomycetes bacterium]
MGKLKLLSGSAVCLTLAVACLGMFPGSAPAAVRTVPQGFAGVAFEPWQMARQGISPEVELSLAAASGVESVRFPIYWSHLQPREGTPYDWAALDRFMEAAARLRVAVLPTLLGAPRWAADQRYLGSSSKLRVLVPASAEAFARFSSAVVERYRRSSPFWTDGRESPLNPVTVKAWQVWNEPDMSIFWPQHYRECQVPLVSGACPQSTDLRFAPTYLVLLRQASRAIKAADPNAKVMLASLTNLSWSSLERVYEAGGKGLFDIAAINAFTSTPSNLIRTIAKVRVTLARRGDSRMPLSLTEYSWSASGNTRLADARMGFISVSTTQQARNLSAAFGLLMLNRARYRLADTYWYTWASSWSGADSAWSYSGLRNWAGGTPTGTPALGSFTRAALAAEGCRKKLLADSCLS